MSVDNFDALFNGGTPEEVNDAPLEDELHEKPIDQEDTVSEEVHEDATEEEPETEALPADDEDEVKPHVPLPTFLGMKDKYRDEKAERIAAQEREAALKKQIAQYQAAAPKSDQAPNPFHDPRGYADYRFAEVERQRVNDKILLSGEFAKRSHGADAVTEAANWASARAANDPQFDAQVASQPDPMEWVIQQHKAARQLEDFQRDPEAFARKVAEEKGWLAQPAVMATANVTAPKERKLPKSLSDIPAANPATRIKPVDTKQEFNNLFNG